MQRNNIKCPKVIHYPQVLSIEGDNVYALYPFFSILDENFMFGFMLQYVHKNINVTGLFKSILPFQQFNILNQLFLPFI